MRRLAEGIDGGTSARRVMIIAEFSARQRPQSLSTYSLYERKRAPRHSFVYYMLYIQTALRRRLPTPVRMAVIAQ